MANSTLVFPARPEDHGWLAEIGLTGLSPVASSPVRPEQVRHVLDELGWSYSEGSERWSPLEGPAEEVTHFSCELRDGAWPPFTEITVFVDITGVRHGGYAAFVVAVHASRSNGPLVAWDEGGAGPVLVTPALTYEEFAAGFGYPGDLERDAAWSPARSHRT